MDTHTHKNSCVTICALLYQWDLKRTKLGKSCHVSWYVRIQFISSAVQQCPQWNVNMLFPPRSSEGSWKRKPLLQEAVFGAQKSSAAILLGSDTRECCPDTHYSSHPAFHSVFKQKYSFSLACMSAILHYFHLSFFTDFALLEWIWVSFLIENVQKMKPSGSVFYSFLSRNLLSCVSVIGRYEACSKQGDCLAVWWKGM